MISVSFSSQQRFLISSVLAAVLFFTASIGLMFAAAGLPTTTVELDGYLWSDNIGWVSLNCKTGGTDDADPDVLPEDICAVSNYKVVLTNSTGYLSGWGWSNNVGWIKFNGLSGYPIAAGNTPISAGVNPARTTGDLSAGTLALAGWVRACAGTISPNICTDMTNSSVSGAWDGWISLKGTNGGTTTNMTYGVPIDSTGNAPSTSYGWGSSVVGWINFNLMSLLIPTATLSGTACTIARDANSCANGSLSWVFKDAAVSTRDIVRISPTPADTSIDDPAAGTVPSITGTDSMVEFVAGVNLFQAYYTYPASPIGNQLSLVAGCAPTNVYYPAPADKCDQTMPTVTITADKTLVRSGDTVNITWTITPPAAQPLDPSITCNVFGPGMDSGTNQTTGGSQMSSSIKNGAAFKIVCTPPNGAGSDVTASVSVDVVPTTQEI